MLTVSAKAQWRELFFETPNCIDHEAKYQMLYSCLKTKNIDSVSKAVDYVFHLYKFDREKYPSGLLNPILDSLYSFQLDYSEKAIINRWKSEYYGSNWAFDTIETPNRKFIFTGTEALFYLNDSLTRRTRYSLVRKENSTGDLHFKKFVIVFSDTQEEWSYYFLTEGHSVPFHGNADKTYLLFNKMPGCVCGCPYELYSIETNSKTSL